MKPDHPFSRVFKLYDRIAITGPSGCGKTTLAKTITDRPVFYSDDFKHLGWSEASEETARVINAHQGKLLVEGVAIARALRKGMKVDAVILLTAPKREQLPGQVSQGKGIHKVLNEWRAANPKVPVYVEPVDRYSPFESKPDEGDSE